ncbi:MAG: hypothetical protein HZA03_10035 [Nitrospinae bacterium]|nr:hypothetical protein [Nitrospinota bacterium]
MRNGKNAGAFAAYLVLKALIVWTQSTPRFLGYAAWKGIILLAAAAMKKRVRIAVEQLRPLFPDAPDSQLEKIFHDSFKNLGRFCAEFCWIPELGAENLDRHIRFEGMEHLERAYARGKGVVLVWAHYDQFEGVNAVLAVKGYKVHSVIREVDNPWIDDMLDGIRESRGQKVIKRERAAVDIIARLREGCIVTIAADQNTIYNNLYTKFLGRWASTFKSPAVVSLRTGAAVIPVYSVRHADDSHTAHLLPEVALKRTGDLKRDIFNITQRLADIQADFIRRRPEFWLWIHRRWKTQPDEKEIRQAEEFLAGYRQLTEGR